MHLLKLDDSDSSQEKWLHANRQIISVICMPSKQWISMKLFNLVHLTLDSVPLIAVWMKETFLLLKLNNLTTNKDNEKEPNMSTITLLQIQTVYHLCSATT
ncbi:hypothetical protein Dsin_030382 [Dipteronia sinensis]|uniref:Uncharacterized protein n=1 Tax=Dipteronia sinensis TaxID=43782 RepID=A0AAD9ZIU0_9ROSI|nr:hypothetical protein Dsin_030382 [Dipteronia sinensis]